MLLFGLVGTLVGCSTVTVKGRVVDGLNGQPIAGPYRIKVKAKSADVALSCQLFDAPVGEDGTFLFDKLCPGTAYQIETDREELWFVDVDEIPDGGFNQGEPQQVDLTAWRVPKGAGVYKLSGGELSPLKTDSDVKSVQILKSTEKVRYPENIPNQMSTIGPDDHLLLVGKAAIDELKMYPLVQSGARKFGDGDVIWTMEPWWYVGVTFEDDTKFARSDAPIDSAKVIDKEKGDRRARIIPGSALPEGRYALLREDDRRMYLIAFGKQPPPVAAPAPAPAP